MREIEDTARKEAFVFAFVSAFVAGRTGDLRGRVIEFINTNMEDKNWQFTFMKRLSEIHQGNGCADLLTVCIIPGSQPSVKKM